MLSTRKSIKLLSFEMVIDSTTIINSPLVMMYSIRHIFKSMKILLIIKLYCCPKSKRQSHAHSFNYKPNENRCHSFKNRCGILCEVLNKIFLCFTQIIILYFRSAFQSHRLNKKVCFWVYDYVGRCNRSDIIRYSYFIQ